MPARRPRSTAKTRTVPLASASQRLLFVLALFTFGLASMYTSVALLARVTPALFPGKSLSNLGIIRPLADLNSPLVPIKDGGETSVFNKRINLLILGVDKRPAGGFQEDGSYVSPVGDNGAYLTDTIMVATIDPNTDQLNVLSFPRDMHVDIHTPQWTAPDRINASYKWGVELRGGVRGGVEQVKVDLKENFGIDIDHYVIMDFIGVERMVDTLGGIDVNIPEDLAIGQWYYSDDDENARWIEIWAGPQHLDGYHAVAFGRNREIGSDFARVKRQQLVMEAALAKALSAGFLVDNPAKMFEIWDAYNAMVKTDVPRSKFPGYSALLVETKGTMKTYSLGDDVNGIPTMINHTTEEGAAVLQWNADNVQYWLNQVFPKTSYANATVEVQNGYGEDGSVRSAALGNYLAYVKALPTVYYGPDVQVQPHTTITVYGEGKRLLGEDIARWLSIPPSEVVFLPKDDPTLPDVVVTIGKDFRVPGN